MRERGVANLRWKRRGLERAPSVSEWVCLTRAIGSSFRPVAHAPGSWFGRRESAGLTLIEVVIALTTLTIAAAALLGGSSFVTTLGARDRARMDAHEIAHRVILQHIEDPGMFTGQVKRAEIAGRYYAFTLDEEVVLSKESVAERPASRGSRVSYSSSSMASLGGDDAIKQLNRLVVRVYPDDDNTGPASKIAAAELVRFYSWFGAVDEEDVIRETLRRAAQMLDSSGLGASPSR
ncbi:MAG: prepilin-type N-terminal cleavage/methylation domain-containing protein [Phycisphaerales bacterium]